MKRLFAFFLFAALSQTTHASLVLQLSFEGDFLDSSGFGNDATIDPRSSGTVTTTSGGISGNALSISGGLGWLEVANSASLSPTSELTMSAWVNRTGQIGNNSGIFFKGELVGQQPDWQIVISSGSAGSGTSINGTGFATSASSVSDNTPIPFNDWTHLATTYDGNILKYFINGNLVGTDLYTDIIDTSGSPLYIGNRFRPSGDVGGFQGLLDEIRVYDRALSDSEIRSLAGLNNVPEPPVASLLVLGLLGIHVKKKHQKRHTT